MSIVSVGALLAKAVPFVASHATQIATATSVAATTGMGIFDKIKTKRQQKKDGTLQIDQRIQELESSVKNLEDAALSIEEVQKQYFQCFEVLDGNIKTIEANIDGITAEIQSVREEFTTLQIEQKKAKTGMMVMGIVGGIGIVIAIIMAILL